MRMIAVAVLLLAAATSAVSCAIPVDAVRARERAETLLLLDLERIATNSEISISNENREKFEQAVAELFRRYQSNMLKARTPEDGAKFTAEYQIGLKKTKENYAAQLAVNLRDVAALRFHIRHTIPTINEWNRAEINMNREIFSELMDEEMANMIDTMLDTLIVALEEKERREMEEIADQPVSTPVSEPVHYDPTQGISEPFIPPVLNPPVLNVPENTVTDNTGE